MTLTIIVAIVAFLAITLILVAVTVVVAGGSITHQLVRLRKMFPRLPLKKKGKG